MRVEICIYYACKHNTSPLQTDFFFLVSFFQNTLAYYALKCMSLMASSEKSSSYNINYLLSVVGQRKKWLALLTIFILMNYIYTFWRSRLLYFVKIFYLYLKYFLLLEIFVLKRLTDFQTGMRITIMYSEKLLPKENVTSVKEKLYLINIQNICIQVFVFLESS